MNSIAELMRAAMQKHQITIAELANKIGFTRSYASLVINNRREPSNKFKASVQRLLDLPSVESDQHNDGISCSSCILCPYLNKETSIDFLSMKLNDLETILIEYATALPTQRPANKIISIHILHHILNAIRTKFKKNSSQES